MRSALPKTSRPSSNSPLLPTRDHKWKIPVLNGLIYWGHVKNSVATVVAITGKTLTAPQPVIWVSARRNNTKR
ncbi:hypothetical protein AGR4C_Lc90014 [Agrobacterium tumefaciens str. Kerr 14]|uniref:Uncharacterized protein n=1 Tax=Agrobacterium tumefaciens str. Kerr 14 TaxID=1183424 RepID=A0A1S7S5D0_AGRTU|nr:hypothetical protein AGR4C_Lc90014 [Agrobacterium tumefaciens str. Kerr 14]